MTLDDVRAAGKAGIARALAQCERRPEDEATLVLLDQAWAKGDRAVIGLTGPPGVGKSTLASTMIRTWRASGRSVGVIAIDPSSRRSGGALLGDRTRIDADPDDAGVFIRSMAARDRLGGLADLAAAAITLFRALFDVTLVETVGVGQSETEIGDHADRVILAVQPGSGDALQFIKAGIVEIPDLVVVTKADLGAIAERARADLEAAASAGGGPAPVVLLVSAEHGQGIDRLMELLDCRVDPQRRQRQAAAWLRRWIAEEHGRHGSARAAPWLVPGQGSPFRRMREINRRLGP